MPEISAPVASSPLLLQSAMSPTPTITGSAAGVVLSVRTALVVVVAPSPTVTYHS